MKGLLLKDWYMMKKYCRAYLFMAAIFIVVSLVNHENMFFVFYPCLLCGMIPVNLLGYDERSRWIQYSAALPYTRAQIVSAKYVIGLSAQTAALLAGGIVQGVRMAMSGSFRLDAFLILMLAMLIAAAISSSVCLPFLFKLGVERGRIAYYVMLGLLCAFAVTSSRFFSSETRTELLSGPFMAGMALAGVGIYALSWYLSIVFYRKRELL